MYRVIRAFCDATDNNRFYGVGTAYPAEGVKPTKARIKALSTGENKHKAVYIEEVEDSPEDNAEVNPEE
jgi:hypothetical protein